LQFLLESAPIEKGLDVLVEAFHDLLRCDPLDCHNGTETLYPLL
jgi:hypothetical protein